MYKGATQGHKSVRRGFPERVSLYVLLVVVTLAPLPFGSKDLWIIAGWNVALAVSLLFLPLHRLGSVHLGLLVTLAIFCVAWAVAIHEQISLQPWIARHLANPIWDDTSRLLGLPVAPAVAISKNQPLLALGAPLAAIMSLVCGFVLGQDRKAARMIFLAIAVSGAVYAAYGITSFAIDPTTMLGRQKEAYQSVLTATFVNRNTAATYFGSCAILWLLLLSNQVRRYAAQRSIDREAVKRVFRNPSTKILVPLAAFVMVVLAMFMTGSRAGVLLSLAALTIAFLSYFHRDLDSRSAWLLVIGGIATLVFATWQVMGSGIAERIEQQGFVDSGRTSVYRSTFAIVRDFPWLGTGLGTFAWIFPAYRSSDLSSWGIWDRAHDTLLEIASDLGIPAAALVLLGWMILVAVLFRGVRTRQRDRMFPAAGSAVALLSGLHSLVDFPLQVPGYAIVAFAIIGTGLAQSHEIHVERVGIRSNKPC